MRLCAFITITLLLAATASADVGLLLETGWEGHYRPGHWNPIRITATSPDTREVQLELYTPTDGRYAMRIVQRFPVGPAPRTSDLFAPLSYSLYETSVTLTNPNSYFRTIPSFDQDHPDQPAKLLGQPLDLGQILVGISGNDQTHSTLAGQFRQNAVATGYMQQSYLPSVPVGYDALDVLILSAPDFAHFDADKQNAIIQWVQSGGIVLFWPGTSPLPDSSPLLEALPCKFGDTRTYELTPAQLNSTNLPNRFRHITGRSIASVANNSRDIHPIANSDITAYRRWLGFGQVVALPIDPSTFQFRNENAAHAFWQSILTRVITLPKEDDPNRYNYNNPDQARQMQATQNAMNWLSDIPGAGSFGFSYIAIALAAMMFVVGPVDWFVLKWIGRQPWTWLTTTGWIALITIGAISVGYLLKSGDLHFRTVSIVDEDDGMRVAQTTLAAVYSPRTREYKLDFDPQTWWTPGGTSGFRSPSGAQLEIDAHQDYRGNIPLPMLINVWNLRFLQGTTNVPTGGIISAKLSVKGDKIEGSIFNQSAVALTNVAIQTHDGHVNLATSINAGATLPVSAKLDHSPFPPPTPPYGTPTPTTRPTVQTDGDIALPRSHRIRQILQDRADMAAITADFQAPPQEVKLDEPTAKQEHAGMVRALVQLR